MSAISEAFESASGDGRAAFVSYVMGGDPNPSSFMEYATAVARHSDLVEVGIPFSDPVADGPAVQAAGIRSISSGTRVQMVLDWCAELGKVAPVAVMCYYNTIHRMGEERFASSLRESGVAGLIVPDLPFEEGRGLRKACGSNGVDNILLVTPATGSDRARKIASRSRGFVYLVSRYGVTGERAALPSQIYDLIASCKSVSSVPVAVGFGISTPEQIRGLSSSAVDGIVVGSAIVSRIGSGMPPSEVGEYVSSLHEAARRI